MAARVIVFAICVASALAGGLPAAKYPAGVNPLVCPNYPYCDNVALAVHGAAGHHAVAPYAAPAYSAYGHHGSAAKYPAGVNPHACPNYPYCDNVALAVHGAAGHHAVAPYAAPAYAAYGHHGAAAKYPAGVDPHTCPNYPYCDNVVLAAHGAGAAHGWAGAYGGWAGHAYAAPVLAHGAAHVLGAHGVHGGARYPAGVNPHACPNYPYCH